MKYERLVNIMKKLKKLDSEWLIRKELFKKYCNIFKEIKLKIYNEDSFTNDNYKMNIDYSSFIEENIYKNEKDYFIRFIDSFNRLSLKQRLIIYLCYIENENEYLDLFIAHNMGYSLGYFYNLKKKAILDFTTSFGVITFGQ